jgi:hypothetical protein
VVPEVLLPGVPQVLGEDDDQDTDDDEGGDA